MFTAWNTVFEHVPNRAVYAVNTSVKKSAVHVRLGKHASRLSPAIVASAFNKRFKLLSGKRCSNTFSAAIPTVPVEQRVKLRLAGGKSFVNSVLFDFLSDEAATAYYAAFFQVIPSLHCLRATFAAASQTQNTVVVLGITYDRQFRKNRANWNLFLQRNQSFVHIASNVCSVITHV